ncbi:MAG TPA: hypothetical protein VHZ24_16790 [Pirellulales bacterium]|jgi:hypothetical protein|nr:hypothetical protein [Pirellulales bacterium]
MTIFKKWRGRRGGRARWLNTAVALVVAALACPQARAADPLAGPEARTQIYGIAGQGQKFVYVFDRSASMGEGPGSALRGAKTELLGSLNDLGPTHQFQIIFYNERPTIFPLAGVQGRLVFGSRNNKHSAEEFVDGITAEGGTDHLAALEVALRLDADVIYFLTDADEPGLTAGELERITKRNQAAVINCIEFGVGPKRPGENFLQRLAAANRGQYVYVDTNKNAK